MHAACTAITICQMPDSFAVSPYPHSVLSFDWPPRLSRDAMPWHAVGLVQWCDCGESREELHARMIEVAPTSRHHIAGHAMQPCSSPLESLHSNESTLQTNPSPADRGESKSFPILPIQRPLERFWRNVATEQVKVWEASFTSLTPRCDK